MQQILFIELCLDLIHEWLTQSQLWCVCVILRENNQNPFFWCNLRKRKPRFDLSMLLSLCIPFSCLSVEESESVAAKTVLRICHCICVSTSVRCVFLCVPMWIYMSRSSKGLGSIFYGIHKTHDKEWMTEFYNGLSHWIHLTPSDTDN